ncbi:unnamed protein product [Litomosoides sigmodontis]|uniref:RING-type domain-containing protein n=1 Tax=Litomosoides sigmodontis TaxID=42156 RepID=A0A3P6SMN8_LITSI|nr:unnamed protein product [Litomosoides sigmodontis]
MLFFSVSLVHIAVDDRKIHLMGMDSDVQHAKMHFIRFKNCVVSNTSLWKYCEFHSTCCLNLVFMKDFEELPLVGFSVCSGIEIVRKKLHPSNTVAFKSWDSPKMPSWARNRVKTDDYLRILLRFEMTRLGNKPPIAILNPFEMFTWTAQKKRRAVCNVERKAIKPSAEVTTPTSKKATLPICTFCWERPIDMLLIPCNHAVCCNSCKDNYINYERRRNKTRNISAEVVCPICRKKIESVAQIWFPKNYRCLLCGCDTMSAVAGGENGCGCVIGCYEKARKLCDDGGLCPHCHSKLIDVLHVFIQGDKS